MGYWYTRRFNSIFKQQNNMKDTTYHPDWQKNRISFLLTKYNEIFFKNKNILELGPYNGYIGARFKEMGANVKGVEGRQSNIDNKIKVDYPDYDCVQGNLDTKDWIWGKHDIIINFGLYYHLTYNHKEHLINCINNCKLLFFETVVYNSFESEIYNIKRIGDDQALTDIDGYPTEKYIEDIFKELNVRYTKYTDKALNGGMHIYDWELNNSKIFHDAQRRLWVVENANYIS